mgnify:CR=1 FL=1
MATGRACSVYQLYRVGYCKNLFGTRIGSAQDYILSCSGTIFPGFHELEFKIEQTLVTEAITPMKIWRFSRDEFGQLMDAYPQINKYMLNSYARYINLLLFETAHQEYNSGFVRVCNVILLLHNAQSEVGQGILVFHKKNWQNSSA